MTIEINDHVSSDPHYSLSKKISRGAIWITGASFITRIMNVASAIILARLLIPSDFGLMAIAMSVITISQSTTQTGFESALIQRKGDADSYLDTAWTIELCKFFLLYLIIFITAPLIALFFNEIRAIAIVRLLGISLIFQGLKNIGVVYLRKHLDFQKQFILDIIPLFVYIVFVITLAFYLVNVWALVWANVAMNITLCILSYAIHPYRPRFQFNYLKAKSLFNFGKWIFASSIIVMVKNQGVTMFIGKYLGIQLLGYYNRANAFSTALFAQLNEVVWKVGFPAYSKIQHQDERFRSAFIKTFYLLTFIGFPMVGGLYVLSYDFVHIILTDKWIHIVPLIKILCLKAALGFTNTPASIALQAMGKPSVSTKASFLSMVVLILLIYPMSSLLGIVGSALAILFSVIIISPILWYKIIATLNLTILEFVKPILFSGLVSMLMIAFIITVKNIYIGDIQLLEFCFLSISGIIVYLMGSYIIDRYMGYGVYHIISERIYAFKK